MNNVKQQITVEGANMMKGPWTKETIAAKLASDDNWVIAALLAIYERQTNDEKRDLETKYHNDIGFNCADAPKMSSFAEQVKRWKKGRYAHKYTFPLSQKQLWVARKRLAKYANQLCAIANQNEAAKANAQ
jgi:hypothetical protein